MQRFPFQKDGAQFLADRHRALLFDAPGLGKTVQAIDAADMVGARTHDVICPAGVVPQWRKQHVRLAASDAQFSSRSYESARDKGFPRYSDAATLDEIHYLKNPSSERTVKILGYNKYASDGALAHSRRIWCLSGTPNPRDPSDLFPMMNAIVPGSLQLNNGFIMSYSQFLNKFCVMREWKKGQGNKVIKGKNLAELAERLAPFMLRRTKKEVFPEWNTPVVDVIWFEGGPAADALRKAELTPEGQQLAAIFAAEGFEGLERFAETDNGISKLRRLTGLIKVPLAVEWLKDEWASGMKKVVIMCYHREVIQAIYDQLTKEGFSGVIYWGGMTEAQKEAAKEQYILEDVDFFAGQIDACGTGLDGLQHASSRMLYVEFSWIGEQNQQALDRLDRIGQTEPVLGQYLALEGSLDAGIIEVAARRTAERIELFDNH